MPSELFTQLSDSKIPFRQNEAFNTHLPLRTDGKTTAWVWVKTPDEMIQAVRLCKKYKQRWRIHWPMENWLTKGDWNRVIIRPTGYFSEISSSSDQLFLGAAAMWGQCAGFLKWENDFQDWPGSVGELISGENCSLLKGYPLKINFLLNKKIHSITCHSDEEPPELPKHGIPVSLELGLGRRRRKKSPRAAGDIFKSKSIKAATAFKSAGLLGTRLYDWQLSQEAPGHISHLGVNNYTHLLMLYKGLKERLKTLNNIELELSVPVFGGGKYAK